MNGKAMTPCWQQQPTAQTEKEGMADPRMAKHRPKVIKCRTTVPPAAR